MVALSPEIRTRLARERARRHLWLGAEKVGADWLNSEERRRTLELPMAWALLGGLAVPTAVAAASLGVHLRESPFYITTRSGRRYVKLRTIPSVVARQMQENLGTVIPDISPFCNAVRTVSIDEVPQLLSVVLRGAPQSDDDRRRQLRLWSYRPLDDRDMARYEQANPRLFAETEMMKHDLKIGPGIAGDSQAWRKGRANTLTPEGCTMSMLLDQEFMLHATRQSEVAGYRRLGRVLLGHAEWPVPVQVWNRFEAETQMPRDVGSDLFSRSAAVLPSPDRPLLAAPAEEPLVAVALPAA